MVRLLSSLPEVQLFLAGTKEDIDTELVSRSSILKCDQDLTNEDTPRHKPDTVSLRVCISCSTGTVVSPSCVEWLYQEYTARPHLSGGLMVKREHQQATAWARTQRKHGTMLWQYTNTPAKYLHKVDELTDERLWRPFPIFLVSLIEEQFQQNPFNRVCKINKVNDAYTHMLNFETGEVHIIREKETFCLRCISVRSVEDQITCSMLDKTSYKAASKCYGAAGILFYTFHPLTGEPVFLLGHMNYACRSWCDFGGLKSFRYFLLI